MMKRWTLPAPVLALALAGCGAREIMMGVATLGGAAVGAQAQQQAPAAVVPMIEERMQDKARLATAEFDRMTEAFESERLPRSTSPDTGHKQFCPMVIADMAEIGVMDDGGQALALRCRIEYRLGKAKDAFENHLAAAYDDHLDKADGFIAQLTATLNRYKGASQ